MVLGYSIILAEPVDLFSRGYMELGGVHYCKKKIAKVMVNAK